MTQAQATHPAGGEQPPPSQDMVLAALQRCYDPCCRDKGISVVEMGLIEAIVIEGRQVRIDMVLTSGWCPFAMHLLTMIEQEVGILGGVAEVQVNIVWTPTWTPSRLAESARQKLTLPLEQLLPLRAARLTNPPTAPNPSMLHNQE